ncbi:MAG: aldose epimerase family protein [Paracoccaceae bacterium]
MPRALPGLGRVDGHTVVQARLEAGDVAVTLLSLGCITQDWRLDGQPVVLGYADPAGYLKNPNHFGVIAGRVANRTAGGRFMLDGKPVQLSVNDPPNHLHGGTRGLGARNWRMEGESGKSLRLSYHAPNGEEGYPGAVDFTVTITLAGHRLTYVMEAVPDRPTPINLAQHSYYNLTGGGPVWDHRLHIPAPHYTPVDANLVPTGEIAPTAGTRYDFTSPRTLEQADPDHLGSDINLVLGNGRDPGRPSATVEAGGLALRLWTDEPGLQLYNAMHLGLTPGGHDGQTYDRFHGLCLEPQHFPDSLHNPAFPTIICSPERPYRQTLTVEIAPKEVTR